MQRVSTTDFTRSHCRAVNESSKILKYFSRVSTASDSEEEEPSAIPFSDESDESLSCILLFPGSTDDESESAFSSQLSDVSDLESSSITPAASHSSLRLLTTT